MTTETDRYLIEINSKIIGDEAVRLLTNEIERLNKSAKDTRVAGTQASEGIEKINRSAKQAGQGLGRMGSLFQNVSYQVTDFAVQTSGGVDAMRAFSQQAPQVAGALGAAGIGGHIGLITFALVAMSAAMIPAITAMLNGKNAIKEFDDEIKRLSANKIDFNTIFSNVPDTSKNLDNLNEEGKSVYKTIQDLNTLNDTKIFDALKNQALSILAPIEKLNRVIKFNREELQQSDYFAKTSAIAKQVKAEFGLAFEEAEAFGEAMQKVFRSVDGNVDVESLNYLIRFFGGLESTSEASQENISKINEILQKLLPLAQGLGAIDLGTPEKEAEKTAKQAANLRKEWEALVASFNTAGQNFDVQAAEIRRIGTALGDVTPEMNRLLELNQKQRGESVLKELQSDSESMAGGMVNAVAAVDKLNKGLEYQAGLRKILNQFDPTTQAKQWQAIAESMKDSLLPAEKLRYELNVIRENDASLKAMADIFDSFAKSVGLSAEETEKLRKVVFDLKPEKVRDYDREWEKLSDSLRETEQVYKDRTKDIEEIGKGAGKSAIQINELKQALDTQHSEKVFKEMAADVTTFEGGVYASAKAMAELRGNSAFLKGVREVMAQGIDTSSWLALAKILGDAKTPLETIKYTLESIRKEESDNAALIAAWEAFKQTFTGSAEELEKVRVALFGIKGYGVEFFDEIGEAIGKELTGSIAEFVEVLGDSEKSMSDWAKSLIKSIANVISQMLILKALNESLGTTSFGKWLGLGSAPAPGGSSGAPVPPSNQVATFSAPATMALPLRSGVGLARTSTSLPASVIDSAQRGGSASVNVNVTNYSNAKVETRNNGDDIEIIIGRVANDIMRGGSKVSRALESTYRVNRSGGWR